MLDTTTKLTESAWIKLFDKYDIINRVEKDEMFIISASQIKEFREPRLMAKFDHTVNLPNIFSKNSLTILPISRGDYVISHFDTYHKFEEVNTSITKVAMPEYIQSIDIHTITSEAVALNCAVIAGIMSDMLDDKKIVPTVSGRMGSGRFSFNIDSLDKKKVYNIDVINSQIEIDAAYEGVNTLALFEAKRDLAEDFLVRQLYYPFRVWQAQIKKPVRPMFMVYSNGIYRLYEYQFMEPNEYNSISLIKQKNYSIEDTTITSTEIQSLLTETCIIDEPNIPFPQADSFERVINICELLAEQDLTRDDITEQYAFEARQSSYYTDAARYLGLLYKTSTSGSPVYHLTEIGIEIIQSNYKQRQFGFARLILSHRSFNETLKLYFKSGLLPNRNDIAQIMKASELYNVQQEATFLRRASTVRGWIKWIISLFN